jgi:DNA-binding NarL/FixJ family response regulator
MPKIKCLLVDDHTLFRQGVRRLLESESDFEVVGESPDGGDAVEKARELRPDIVLMPDQEKSRGDEDPLPHHV